MRRWEQCLGLWLGLLGSLAAGPSIAQSITGRVVAQDDGRGLAGVNIYFDNLTLGTASDAAGFFTLTQVPAGSHTLIFSMIGYRLEEVPVHVTPGQAQQLRVTLHQDIVRLNPVVVVTTKREQELLRSPVSVAAVSAREIAEKGVYAVDEAMVYVSGVQFIGNQINIRNASGFMYGAGTRTVVLVDGIPINASDTGEINWDLIPLLDVTRIEVIKGAGSFLYGTNALGGVINIVTRTPGEKGRLLLQTSVGFYAHPHYAEWQWTDRTLYFNRQDIGYSRQFGRLAAQVSIRRDESLGYMENNYHHRVSGSAKLVYRLSPAAKLTFYGALMRDRRGEFVMWRDQSNVLRVPDAESAQNLIKMNHGMVYLIYSTVHSPRFSSKIRVSLNDLLLGNQFGRSSDFFPAIGPGLELSATYLSAGRHTLTSGLEVKTDRAHIKQIGRHSAYTIAPYVQHEFKVSSATTLTTGLRYDFYKLDDRKLEAQLSPRLGLNTLLKRHWSLRASAGRGYRSPAIVERFLRLSISGFEVFPNPDLKSERAWSYEIGSRFNILDSWIADAAIFQSDYWDLIEPTIDITSNAIQFLNVSRPRIRGLEIMTRLSWWRDRIGLEANLTLMDHEDLSNHEPLYYRPRQMAKIMPQVRLGPVSLQAEYHYASRAERVQVFPLDERLPMHLWHFKGSMRWRQLRFTAAIHNVFNYNYTTRERFLEPIRHFNFGVQAMY